MPWWINVYRNKECNTVNDKSMSTYQPKIELSYSRSTKQTSKFPLSSICSFFASCMTLCWYCFL